MEISYVVESVPDHTLGDRTPSLVSVDYYYDLELDKKGNILGGEWYNNNHPDFLWTPTPQATIQTYGDYYAGNRPWDSSRSPLDRDLVYYGLFNASKGLPLGIIVDELFRQSAKPSHQVYGEQ